MHKQKIRLIHETLLMLAETSPSDAFLVKMHLEGLEYKQMAERDLGNKPYSQRELKKKTNAIKKQFTRKSTGSLAKFKSCLKRIMAKNKLFQDDILN
jgi:RNA polymerase sigma-70 factor (ECF subfamily)